MMEHWLLEKLNETSLGGYTLMLACFWWIGQNIFRIISSWNDSRRLTLEEKQANREGFTQEVAGLRAENRALLEDQRKLREEYDAHRKICQEETDHLRDHIVALENHLGGVLRKIASLTIRMAQGEITPDIASSILALAQDSQQVSFKGKRHERED